MACLGSPISTSVRWPWKASAQDVPLCGVGVLELVDEHDLVTRAHPFGGRRPVLGVHQRVAQQHHAGRRSRAGDARACGARPRRRAAPAKACRWPGTACGRPRRRARARPAGRRRRPCRRVARRWACSGGCGTAGVPLQVEVVDHLVDEVGDVGHEHRVGVDVAGDPERREHLLAEAVGRRDGGGVELRQGAGQPGPPPVELDVVDGRQVAHEVVGAGRAPGSRSCRSAVDQSARARGRAARTSRPGRR